MPWNNRQKFLLIQHVRDTEYLWQPDHILYSKKDSKEPEWDRIGKLLGSTKAETKAEWRKLRINYMANPDVLSVKGINAIRELPVDVV